MFGDHSEGSFHARIPRIGGALAAALLVSTASVCSAATFLTGTGGVTSKFKGIATGTDLICNLSGVPIEATVSPLSLVVGGASGATVQCNEVLTSTDTVTKTGLFTLTQTTLDNCLTVSTAAGQTTWTCQIPGAPVLPPKARWRVTPQPDFVNLFCEDPESEGGNFDPCYAELGTPEPVVAADFPDRDVNGDALADFGGATGVVFTFRAPDGIFNWGPCHSGTFDGGQPVLCSQTVNVGGIPTQFLTQSIGAADADLIIAVDTGPDSLNLKNKSTTAAFPVTFFGANDVDITQVTKTGQTGQSAIFMVGSNRFAQPIKIKHSSYADVAGPTGFGDGFLDLKVQFFRGDIKTPGTIIYAITHPNGAAQTVCPSSPQSVKVNFRGILNGNATSVWVGTDDLTIFNCP